MGTSLRSSFAAFLLTVGILPLGVASAQSPWTVTVTPRMDPLPIGFCAAVQIAVVDASGDVPRNSAQTRVTIADFDMTVTGGSVVGQQIDASHWQVCACQGGSPGARATITATYPARALAPSLVAGAGLTQTATFVLSAPKGTSDPAVCTTNAGRPVGVALPPTAPPVSLATPPATPPATPATRPTPIGAATGGRTQLRVRPIASVQAGTPFSVTIEAVNPAGAVVPTFNGQIMLSAAATGGANFAAGTVSKRALTGGVVTLTGLVLNNAANGYTVTASELQGTLSGVSNTFSVTATGLRLALPPAAVTSTLTAGTPFTVVVQALDSNFNVAENFAGSVTLHAAAPAAGDFAAPPTVTAVAGIATFSGLVLNTAANGYVLTASSAGLPSFPTNAFTVAPSASSSSSRLSNSRGRTQLRVRPIASVQAGTPFSVTIEAVNPAGAVVPTFNGQIMLSAAATGGANFAAGTVSKRALTGGVVTLTGLVLNNAANGYTVTASELQGTLSGVSNTFSVTAAGLRIVLPPAAVTSTLTAGTPFTVVVQALDSNFNVAENFAGSVTLHAAAPAAGDFAVPPTVTAVAGIATFSGLVLNTAANGYVLTASSAGLPSFPTNAFTVAP